MEAFQQLEKEFGESIGNENCVAVSSGSAALHLSLEVLKKKGWNDRARVIVPDFTMVACARAVTMAGMIPAFVDCTDNLLMSMEMLPTWNVRAIMPVHIYGRVCDMNKVSAYAQTNQVAIVEDLAEAHGILPHPETDAACWSFYKNKIITGGEEGGMIAFKKAEDANKARQLRSLGFTEAHDFQHIPRGCNYRLANALASLIIPSLRDMNKNLDKRRQVEAWYDEIVPVEWRMPQRDVVWVYDLRLPHKVSADYVVKQLNQENIAARHSFKPMLSQEEYLYHEDGFIKAVSNAQRLSQEVIYLPVTPDMTKSDIEHVTNRLLALVK